MADYNKNDIAFMQQFLEMGSEYFMLQSKILKLSQEVAERQNYVTTLTGKFDQVNAADQLKFLEKMADITQIAKDLCEAYEFEEEQIE